MTRLPLPRDPRWFQIAVLSALLVYGVGALDFEVRPGIAAVILGVALGVQALADRWGGRPFEPKSALISALSLCLLLRTPSPALAAAAAAISIGSKPLIRIGGKHVFNPSNLGLVVVVLASERAWVSPGQWGNAALLAFAFVCLGSVVVRRAARSDVTWAFLAFWVAALFWRAAWLGDPWAIPLHQLASGSLLLFAFFMISDPKTTPDSRAGRILFAALVAAGGAWVLFKMHRPEGPIFALVACSLLVPLIDRLLPGPKYRWAGTGPEPGRSPRRVTDTAAQTPAAAAPLGAPALVPSAEA
jgi:Na+-translocating ferredoxin:NAD+ oxidoreductase RnfD subunit